MEQYLDTLDLIERRDELKEQILDAYNEEFGTDFTSFDEVALDRINADDFETSDIEGLESFTDLWRDEYSEIEEIDEMEVLGDFQYGVTLIHESVFTEYCEELCTDCGYISKDFPSWIEIDWESTADNIKADYTEITYLGETYLARS